MIVCSCKNEGFSTRCTPSLSARSLDILGIQIQFEAPTVTPACTKDLLMFLKYLEMLKWGFPCFHSHGGAPTAGWFIRENPISKWMMTGGTPIYGNHQVTAFQALVAAGAAHCRSASNGLGPGARNKPQRCLGATLGHRLETPKRFEWATQC